MCYLLKLKKINYFVFIIQQVNNHGLSRRWVTETDVKHFKSGALEIITNITRNMVNWKKEFLHRYISKILFCKMQIYLMVFFKDFADRFRSTYLKNGFLWSCFSKILLIDFRIATSLKTGLSKQCSWRFCS